ncbi:hypothetical protein E2C01_095158 [Portunus trituberculatus]|uniref:Uncharacterized protein n=1 Tax=Portunus trituberculatus TaxID=210409 RepID=A0A5B7K305_PORTR|nr:hypothetical protein [Portunus trituberculatus]
MERGSGSFRRFLEVVGSQGQVVEVRGIGRRTLVGTQVDVWTVANVPHRALLTDRQRALEPSLAVEDRCIQR